MSEEAQKRIVQEKDTEQLNFAKNENGRALGIRDETKSLR